MVDTAKVNLLIDRLVQGMQELKLALNSDGPQTVTTLSVPVQAQDDMGSFDKLKQALESDKWPEAVNKNLICDPKSEIDKVERGRGVVELLIEENLNGTKFLDYGCGEGYCTFYASEKNPAIAVGYDVKEQNWQHFQTKPNLVFTANKGVVADNGPYDVILLFDVIDHLDGASPTDILKEVASLLTPNGKIYMRTHPFTARHATHLYHDCNKAFAHLVFTEEELKELVPEAQYVEPNAGVTTPLATYAKCLDEAKLTVVHRREIKDKVENFFKIPKIAERIMKKTKTQKLPEFQMSIQFIDYILKKA
jgi:2-polyprenyl-3-methyl-5-hydroxy-6-metoxy-1,4-benzoquinol methylase